MYCLVLLAFFCQCFFIFLGFSLGNRQAFWWRCCSLLHKVLDSAMCYMITSMPFSAVIFLAICLYLLPNSKCSVQNHLLDFKTNKQKSQGINCSACSMVEVIFVSGDLCSMTHILKSHNLCSFIPVLASLPFSFLEFANMWFSFVELFLS